MKKIGMNTATSELQIEMIVKPTSREPFNAAWNGAMPCSTWRMMFSSITIASSTTRPDGQRQPEQGNIVQTCSRRPTSARRTEQGNRQRQRGTTVATSAAGKKITTRRKIVQQHRQRDVVQGLAHGLRAIVGHVSSARPPAAGLESRGSPRERRRPPPTVLASGLAQDPSVIEVSPLKCGLGLDQSRSCPRPGATSRGAPGCRRAC